MRSDVPQWFLRPNLSQNKVLSPSNSTQAGGGGGGEGRRLLEGKLELSDGQ